MIQLESDSRIPKYQVLRRVAQLVFAGELDEEHIQQIPFDIIPGPQARFRCCVYREREIVRQRVWLAMGQSLLGAPGTGSVIHVIPAACEECPIHRFQVTESCQKCLAKHCMAACPFGAITMSGRGAHIDQTKCRECGRCAAACPYNAITDQVRPCKRACPVGAIQRLDNYICAIDEGLCISCGACMAACPFGAISDQTYMLDVIDRIRTGQPTVAILAPALEGQFGPNVSMGHLRAAAVRLGFTACYDVAMGADAAAVAEARELANVIAAGGKMTTSCCPAFVNMITLHFPQLLPYVSSIASPMVITARWVRLRHPGARVVFIGPCVAKKTEQVADGIDHVLTGEELLAMFDAQGVDPETCEPLPQEASLYGKGFAESGGVTAAVLQALEECQGENAPAVSTQRCDGAAECKKALAMLKSGRFPANFIEGMACEGGCGGGPVALIPSRLYKAARKKLLAEAEEQDITQSVAQNRLDGVDAHRHDRP